MNAGEAAHNYLTNTYGPPKIVVDHAQGVWIYDINGKKYLDLLSGIAVNALGYAHPQINAAVNKQMNTVGHLSNFFTTSTVTDLAKSLVTQLPHGTYAKVFFCNSGAEANEAAIKLSRLRGKSHLISATNAFHGRTMGALALTAQPAKQAPFEPLIPQISHVEYGNIDALEQAITPDTAAVFLEPIMGESGVVVPPAGYLQAVRSLTRERDVMLVFDEIQTGIGRTGYFYSFLAEEGLIPDAFSLAKGLGGGLPMGALVAVGEYADLLQPGHHGSTFGGNPIAAAAGQVVVDTVSEPGFLQHVRDTGNWLVRELEELHHPQIAQVRGRGLLVAIECAQEIAAHVDKAAVEAGFIINHTNAKTVRLAPPLIIEKEQLRSFIEVFPQLIDSVLS